jgi:hypothetical protein
MNVGHCFWGRHVCVAAAVSSLSCDGLFSRISTHAQCRAPTHLPSKCTVIIQKRLKTNATPNKQNFSPVQSSEFKDPKKNALDKYPKIRYIEI